MLAVCLQWRRHTPTHPALRGASWINNPDNARCSYRNRNQPDNFNNNIGFRVVLSIALCPVRSVNRGTALRLARRCPIKASAVCASSRRFFRVWQF